jgi:hypothetical protein
MSCREENVGQCQIRHVILKECHRRNFLILIPCKATLVTAAMGVSYCCFNTNDCCELVYYYPNLHTTVLKLSHVAAKLFTSALKLLHAASKLSAAATKLPTVVSDVVPSVVVNLSIVVKLLVAFVVVF